MLSGLRFARNKREILFGAAALSAYRKAGTGMNMEKLNLVLKFKLTGDRRLHVKGAARIKVGGSGVMFYDAETGVAEKIDLGRLQSFCIHPVSGAGQTALQ